MYKDEGEDIVLSGSIVEYEDLSGGGSKPSICSIVDHKLSKSESYNRPIQGKKAELIKIKRS